MPAPPASPPPPAPPLVRYAVPVLLAAVALAYLTSLRAPFVYDDVLAIPQNPTIRQLWPLGRVLLPEVEGGVTVAGRPILNLSFALNYFVSGEAVWSYHLVNLLVHAGSALLLYGAVRRTLARGGARWGDLASPAVSGALALGIAAVWALHPLHTQAVTYLVQRAESLMGFFYLLTLYGFVRSVAAEPAQRWRWGAVSVAACLLGMGTKEVMATAPVMVLLYDRTFVAGSFRGALGARRRFYAGLFASWLLLAALLASTGGNRGGTVGVGVGVPLWAYPLTQFETIARYLGLGLWPSPLVFEYGTLWVRRLGDVLPYLALVLPLAGATLLALWRWPVAGFFGGWFFGILAPTSLAPGTIQMIVEHRVYLPLAALVTGLAVLAYRAGGRRLALAAAAAAVALGALTAHRNLAYRSHLALWHDTLAKRPENPRAHEGMAEAWTEAGRPELAVKHRQESLRLQPGDSTYHYNLGMSLADAGRWEDAVRHYELSLRLVPTEARAHNNLAIALVKLGRHEEALQHYAATVRLRPDDPQYRYNLGVALQRAGRLEEALEAYGEALRLRPDHADAHFNAGTALAKLKRLDEAFGHYREAVRLRPDDAGYRTTLGAALLHAGRPADAIAEYRQTLAVKADAPEALAGLADALAAARQSEEAVATYERLLRLAPGDARTHFRLGNALLDLDRVPEAATHFEAATRLAPRDAEAQHNLGVAYARMERWPEARRQFEAALSLKPEYPEAQRNLAQLRRLMGN